MFGDADYRLIMLEQREDEGKPTIRIMKFFGIDNNVEDKIVYTDKIMMMVPDVKLCGSIT